MKDEGRFTSNLFIQPSDRLRCSAEHVGLPEINHGGTEVALCVCVASRYYLEGL